MGIWQKRLDSWARWWNTQIKVITTQFHEQMGHPVPASLRASWYHHGSLNEIDWMFGNCSIDRNFETAAVVRNLDDCEATTIETLTAPGGQNYYIGLV